MEGRRKMRCFVMHELYVCDAFDRALSLSGDSNLFIIARWDHNGVQLFLGICDVIALLAATDSPPPLCNVSG